MIFALLLACQPAAETPTEEPLVPIDADAPWARFRADSAQTGRGRARASDGAGTPWTVSTGKGIFASPVVDAQGTVYIGSADRMFRAIDAEGTVRWSFETGEIIDSSALLDDEGRVIFGSGDGHVYALDRATGAELWRFAAEDPAETGAIINWFEGNVGMGPGGTLYAPNDNFRLYALDRETGAQIVSIPMPDQTWGLPAIDEATGRLYASNLNLIAGRGGNTLAFEADGTEVWSEMHGLGSIAASPLLSDGQLILGSFDGHIRAMDPETGAELWAFAARDHVYASAAALSDGTLVVPGADGTVYALAPDDGAVRWTFDTPAPIRSSPAIGADDVIYVGGGDGVLYAINSDGSPRWSYLLSAGERNDLNASPALGPTHVVIGGEDGGVHAVPYDWCLGAGASDPRCVPPVDLDDGTTLVWTTRWGGTGEPPAAIHALEPLTLGVVSRAEGRARVALLDEVTIDPPQDVVITVSGDRRLVTIEAPPGGWTGDALDLTVTATTLIDPERAGLAMSGGAAGPTITQPLSLAIARDAAPADPPGTARALARLAVPMPTLLPSYNQIGFDSLHYVLAVLTPDLWLMVGGTTDGAVDPASEVRIPLLAEHAGGATRLSSDGGMELEAMGLALRFGHFVLSAGPDADSATLLASATCGDIPLYGVFLRTLGLCNPTTDVIGVLGGIQLGAAEPVAEVDVGDVTFSRTEDGYEALVASPPAGEHLWSLILVDADTGVPVAADYGTATTLTPDGAGLRVSVPAELPARVAAWLVADAAVVGAASE